MAEQKFEDALKKLEAIVDELEGGGLNLDEAIKKYEEGMKLSTSCYKRLGDIQKKVEILTKDSSGKITVKDLNTSGPRAEEASSRAESKKQPLGIKRKRPKGEELLF